jgi:hypothetical protein
LSSTGYGALLAPERLTGIVNVAPWQPFEEEFDI